MFQVKLSSPWISTFRSLLYSSLFLFLLQMSSAPYELSAPRAHRTTSQEKTSPAPPPAFPSISNGNAWPLFSGVHFRLKLILIIQWKVLSSCCRRLPEHYLKPDQATYKFKVFAQMIFQKYWHTVFYACLCQSYLEIISSIFFVVAV